MDRAKRFANKMTIYSLGNFGAKILAFLIVPYYTYMLSSEEFGYYDLLISTISLFTPLLTLQTNEAIITGCIDKNIDSNKIVKTTFVIDITNSAIFFIIFFLFNLLHPIRYGLMFAGALVLSSIMGTVQQYARGYSYSKIYALSGVIYTLFFLIFNILNLSVFRMGADGLLLSGIFSSLASILFLMSRMPEIREALMIKVDRKSLDWIVSYSLPLIPNTMCWWVINASDRYVIKIFLGETSNGIYALSYRFTAVMTTMTNLVYLAWQEISLEEYSSEDKTELFSKAFNIYMKLLLCLSGVCICITRPIVERFMHIDYQSAWKYVPYLYIGTACIGLSTFLNTTYLAEKKTGEILRGTILVGIVNLVTDLLFIRTIGIYAAAISTMISGIMLLLKRIFDNRDAYGLQLNWGMLIGLLIANIIISWLVEQANDQFVFGGLFVLVAIGTIVLNKELIVTKQRS